MFMPPAGQFDITTLLEAEEVIFDTDGVLLDWVSPFAPWAARRLNRPLDPSKITEFNLTSWLGVDSVAEMVEMVTLFNGSAEHGFDRLPPMPGAVDIVALLHARGTTMRVVTSCSDDPAVKDLRVGNLVRTFGDVFQDIVVLGLGADKTAALKRFDPALWIDDHWPNLDAGAAAGHSPILMNASYNQVRLDGGRDDYPRITDWRHLMADIQPAGLAASV